MSDSVPHANPINLSCGSCRFEWTNVLWMPLDIRRFSQAMKAMCECPSCHASGCAIKMGHPSAQGGDAAANHASGADE